MGAIGQAAIGLLVVCGVVWGIRAAFQVGYGDGREDGFEQGCKFQSDVQRVRSEHEQAI